MLPIYFANNSLKLRAFETDDQTSLSKNANNISIWNMVRDRFPHPYTIDDAIYWINYCKYEQKPSQLAIVLNEEVIGGIGFILGVDIEKISAEIGYWVAEKEWGKGIISEAVPLFLNYTFENFETINRLYATVFQHNTASSHVLQKLGFRKEGILIGASIKNDKIYNSEMFAITRQEYLDKFKS